MEISPETFNGEKLDFQQLETIAKQLEEYSQADCFQIIKPFLIYEGSSLHCLGVHRIGLYFVEKTIQEKAYLIEVLELALQYADASRIRKWIEAVLPGLGFVGICQVIEKKMGDFPKGSDSAIYWLGWLIPQGNSESKEALDNLVKLANQTGIIRQPKIIPIYK